MPGFLATAENELNIREAGNTSAALVGRLPLHAIGSVLADEGEWLKIRSGGVEGYVAAQYTVRGEEALHLALSVLKNAEGGYHEPTEAYAMNGGSTDPENPTVPSVTPPEGANGLVVCIDPGHQQHGISEMEPKETRTTSISAKP